VTFGSYNSATLVLNRLYEALPSLVLGRILMPSSVGLFNRALIVSQLPDRFVLPGLPHVALPALAAEVREGRDLKEAYLGALGYITVVQWPALILTPEHFDLPLISNGSSQALR
jgi:lipopolysaccharide exporter